MATVNFPTQRVLDWSTFHEVSREVFGFPGFYGMNMDAWIDCLTYLDDGMSRFELSEDEDLEIKLRDAQGFQLRLPEIFEVFLHSVDFINRRNIETGARSRIRLTLE